MLAFSLSFVLSPYPNKGHCPYREGGGERNPPAEAPRLRFGCYEAEEKVAHAPDQVLFPWGNVSRSET